MPKHEFSPKSQATAGYGGMSSETDTCWAGKETQIKKKQMVNLFFFSLFSSLFIYFLFYYSYVHTRLGSFLPPAPTPSLTTHSLPHPLNTQQKLFCPYI
jgi:hypothetical protein